MGLDEGVGVEPNKRGGEGVTTRVSGVGGRSTGLEVGVWGASNMGLMSARLGSTSLFSA